MAFSLYGNWYLDMTMHVIIVVLLVHAQRKAGSSTDSVILLMSFPSFNKSTTEGGFVNFHKEHFMETQHKYNKINQCQGYDKFYLSKVAPQIRSSLVGKVELSYQCL